MHPIFRYTTMMIILILTSIYVLILPAEAMTGPEHHAMTGPEHHVDPITQLAQEDARRDVGLGADLRWFAYGTGCWMFAVVHASVNNPTVPSDRLLGKSPKYVNTYTDAYKRSIKDQRMEMSATGWVVSLVTTLWLWNIFTD